MILKENSIELNFTIKDTESKSGLGENDYWCNLNINIKNKDKEYNLNGAFISKQELEELKTKLKEFLTIDKIYHKRLSFIKNYFIFYLEGSKKNKKLIIKFIHIDNKNNYSILLNQEEIKRFIYLIDNYNEKD